MLHQKVGGVKCIPRLIRYTEKELLELHGFGPKALRLLKVRLSEKGLSLSKK